MSEALFGDFSDYQGEIDWSLYTPWSKRGDGIPRVGLRAGQGVGVPDRDYLADLAGARASGIQRVYHYWYAYPNLHPGAAGAQAEAASFLSTIAGQVQPLDRLMLDLEQNESSDWAKPFGLALRTAYPGMAKPVLYDSLAHIQAYLQDPELPDIFDLAVADWTFDPEVRPAAPAPWTSYLWLQFSDRLQIPGITGPADADIFLGGDRMVPAGWTDDPATETLTAPNGVVVRWGFRQWVLAHPWDAADPPYAPEYAFTWDGKGPGSRQDYCSVSLGYTDGNGVFLAWLGVELHNAQAEIAALKAQPPTQGDPKADEAKAALRAWLGV